MFKINKKILNLALFFTSIGILVYFCLLNNNILVLISQLPNLNFFWLSMSFIAFFLTWYFDSRMLFLIIENVVPSAYNWVDSIKLTITGAYFSSITPMSSGGQPAQIIHFHKKKVEPGTAVSILMKKFIIIQTITVIFSFIVIFLKSNEFKDVLPAFEFITFIGIAMQSSSILLFYLFKFNKKITIQFINSVIMFLSKIKFLGVTSSAVKKTEEQLMVFVKSDENLRFTRFKIFKIYMLGFLQFISFLSVTFFIYKAFNGEGFPVFDIIASQSYINMISSAVPLPGGAGISESGFVLLLSDFFGESALNSAMILFRIITFCQTVIIGYFVAKKHLTTK